MSNSLLQAAYSPEEFREQGHRLIDELANHLDATLGLKASRVLNYTVPDAELAYWQEFLHNGASETLNQNIISHSTHVHHPRCIGHQVCPPVPSTSLAGLVSSVLNNGMAVYEMGMASSAIERIVTDVICKTLGYGSDSRGFLTSGGTLANLTALLSARKAKVPHDVWNKGHKGKLGIMVSEEAHYCVDRAARIMGLGEAGIIKIPVDAAYTMDVSLLEPYLEKAKDAGIRIFAVVGSAPTTATGIYDDLEAIASFCDKHSIWFHVDGAHGGAAIFSPKYRHTVKGIEMADSVVIDGHKMMMLPTITTALLFRDRNNSHATFSQKADYLLVQSEDEDWYNPAKRTFECTKTMMSIQWYTLLKQYGTKLFDEYLTSTYDLGAQFGEMIQNHPAMELAVSPMSNIVCFRYRDPALDEKLLNVLNAAIRKRLLEDGTYYIVQTKLNGIHYLRTTIMNPFTTLTHLTELLNAVEETGEALKAQAIA